MSWLEVEPAVLPHRWPGPDDPETGQDPPGFEEPPGFEDPAFTTDIIIIEDLIRRNRE